MFQRRLRVRKAGRPRMKISKRAEMANLQRIESRVIGSTEPLLLSIPRDPHLDITFHIQETFLDFPEGLPLPGSDALVHCPITGTVAQ